MQRIDRRHGCKSHERFIGGGGVGGCGLRRVHDTGHQSSSPKANTRDVVDVVFSGILTVRAFWPRFEDFPKAVGHNGFRSPLFLRLTLING